MAHLTEIWGNDLTTKLALFETLETSFHSDKSDYISICIMPLLELVI